ncbi:hypothetical protein DFH11DRAFT_1547070 [Phellopilus nigrolimitatus]|nr:hypothetical protein DFH11DRAFT_1547070 [Phellopilus nigrolimitatus]
MPYVTLGLARSPFGFGFALARPLQKREKGVSRRAWPTAMFVLVITDYHSYAEVVDPEPLESLMVGGSALRNLPSTVSGESPRVVYGPSQRTITWCIVSSAHDMLQKYMCAPNTTSQISPVKSGMKRMQLRRLKLHRAQLKDLSASVATSIYIYGYLVAVLSINNAFFSGDHGEADQTIQKVISTPPLKGGLEESLNITMIGVTGRFQGHRLFNFEKHPRSDTCKGNINLHMGMKGYMAWGYVGRAACGVRRGARSRVQPAKPLAVSHKGSNEGSRTLAKPNSRFANSVVGGASGGRM